MSIEAFAWRVCDTCKEEDIFPIDDIVTIQRVHKRPNEMWRVTIRGVYPDSNEFVRELEGLHIYLRDVKGNNKYDPVCDMTHIVRKEVWVDGLTPIVPGDYEVPKVIVIKIFCSVKFYGRFDPLGSGRDLENK